MMNCKQNISNEIFSPSVNNENVFNKFKIVKNQCHTIAHYSKVNIKDT